MEAIEYDRMYAQEQRHFWFRAVRAIVLDQVRDLLAEPVRVLDAGCGTGGLLSLMPDRWSRVGVDFSQRALDYTRTRAGVPTVRSDLGALPFADRSFDVVFALDVVEHCDDDAKVVSELARVLTPGGRLIVTVPAFQFLWSAHDVALHHRRRYRRPQLTRVLELTRLRIDRISYFNSALFAPIAGIRLARRFLPSAEGATSDAVPLPDPINELLYTLMSSERSLLRRTQLPFGVSLLAVATRE
jgi:SAM-dependent methyltransferase